MEILLISPCHKNFGGWYRANNIATHLTYLNHKVTFLYPSSVNNLWKRVLNGLVNCKHLFKYDIIHIFEIVQPETLLPALLARFLGKRVIIDVADEWLFSPTYKNSNFLTKLLIRFIDLFLINLFPLLTVTSDYLVRKYGRGFKLINGVNEDEFELIHRNQARKQLRITYDVKVLLAFGNTWGNQRIKLLKEVYQWVKLYDDSIQLVVGTGWDKKKLSLWLGACDLVLFPTGGEPCEAACFPIRVGSCLNAERVIATDTSYTEFHSILGKYNCLLVGDYPRHLATNIIKFFKDKSFRKELEENVKVAKKELSWNKLIGKLEEFYK